VDLVALLEQELGEVAAVLAGDAGDEGLASRHSTSAWDRERATLHRVETGPKPPALRPRLNVKGTKERGGVGKRKGTAEPAPGAWRREAHPAARPDVPAASDVAPSKPRRTPRAALTPEAKSACYAIPSPTTAEAGPVPRRPDLSRHSHSRVYKVRHGYHRVRISP